MVAGAVIVLVIAAPLLTLDLELFFLNLVRAGHRGAAASAVHAPASSDREVPALTEGAPAPSYPSQHARAVSILGRPFFFARKRAQSARQLSTGT